MRRHLPNQASVLIAVAAIFFVIGHAATGATSQPSYQEAFGPVKAVHHDGVALSVATCPTGWTAISGGWAFTRATNDLVSTYDSAPTRNLRGWSALEADSSDAATSDERARGYGFAICAS